MALVALRRFIGAAQLGRTHADGPVCRSTLDLRRLPWGADPEAAKALLRGRPGVLDVRVDARGGQAVVWHDSRTSFAQLYNWLQAQAGAPDHGRRR
ncbi:hypothetical protein ACL02T_10915 [Pseudonocardia sp. RS010]|uniref:hypothetical protein n=1 Tax=Pseudonocardia sp. RS010 TaxID=3385979 RepID=UPI0039A2412C